MRIAYGNQIDDLAATQITALTENSQYPATNMKDQRLTTQWWSTSPTSQTIIFNAGSAPVEGHQGQPMFPATTNLVTSPEDYTTGWAAVSCTVSTVSETITGFTGSKLTNSGAVAGYVTQNIGPSVLSTAQTPIFSVIMRKDTSTQGKIYIYDGSAASVIGQCEVTFATKAVTYATGSEAIPAIWIDDNTVRVFLKCIAISTSATVIQFRNQASVAATTGLSTIYTAAMVVNNSYPLAYTATTRAAWATAQSNIAYRLPPSGKFIIDCEVFPYFTYDITTAPFVWCWRNDATHYLQLVYAEASDAFILYWYDAGTQRAMTGPTFDSGTTRTINQSIRMVTSIDISVASVTTGSRMFTVSRKQGAFSEASAWSGAIDEFTSTFPTLDIGLLPVLSTSQINGIYKYFRIYGGTLTETITTEAELDTALESRQLTYAQEYQGTFDFNTVALMGHNISEEASIKVEANDWNEWNYTDGSGSSIIQQSLTWHEDTPILHFFSSIYKRQYVKLTINDPNNDDAALQIGRVWIGDYVTIDPSSLLNFKVTKKRSDRVIHGINRQKWSDTGVGWRHFEFSFPRTETTTLNIIQTMYDTVGNHDSFIFCNFDSIRTFEIVTPCYCSFNGEIGFTHTRNQKYEYSLSMEEEL